MNSLGELGQAERGAIEAANRRDQIEMYARAFAVRGMLKAERIAFNHIRPGPEWAEIRAALDTAIMFFNGVLEHRGHNIARDQASMMSGNGADQHPAEPPAAPAVPEPQGGTQLWP